MINEMASEALAVSMKPDTSLILHYVPVASLALLHLPALGLATLGLFTAVRQAGRTAAGTVLKSLTILVIPFFLLGFLSEFVSCIAKFCCMMAAQKSLNYLSIISFLGPTAKSRTLGLDVARVFCGSIFQLILQVC